MRSDDPYRTPSPAEIPSSTLEERRRIRKAIRTDNFRTKLSFTLAFVALAREVTPEDEQPRNSPSFPAQLPFDLLATPLTEGF